MNGEDYFNVASASMILALLMGINACSLVVAFSLLTGASNFSSSPATILFVGAMSVAAVANYMYFSRNSRYLKILEKFGSNRILERRNRIVFPSLLIGSLLLLFALWFIAIRVSR